MLSVIIPAYNEQHTIAEVIAAVVRVPLHKEIIVVDDGSTDETRRVVENLPADYPLKLLRLPENRGKGTAIRHGLKSVTGDVIIIQDADLENDPSDYPDIVAPILSGEAQVVYGSRFLHSQPSMSKFHCVANRTLTLLVNLLFHTHLTDESTCYKAFDARLLQSLKLTCRGFEFCPEVTSKVLRAGCTIQEVPISYHPRTKAQGKKLNYWCDGWIAVWTLLKYRFAPKSSIFR